MLLFQPVNHFHCSPLDPIQVLHVSLGFCELCDQFIALISLGGGKGRISSQQTINVYGRRSKMTEQIVWLYGKFLCKSDTCLSIYSSVTICKCITSQYSELQFESVFYISTFLVPIYTWFFYVIEKRDYIFPTGWLHHEHKQLFNSKDLPIAQIRSTLGYVCCISSIHSFHFFFPKWD